MTRNLWVVALLVVLLNLPFGFWRASVRKLSAPWFLAVHLPVPLVVALRFGAGLDWRLSILPVLAGAYLSGQLLGGAVHTWWASRRAGRGTAARARSAPRGGTGA